MFHLAPHRRRFAGCSLAAIGFVLALSAAAQQAPRGVVPIREVVIRPAGAARATVPLQMVERVSCVDGRSCPADRMPPAAYGLMGSGQPGQGFRAIIGTRLNDGDVPNPLVAMGIRRWSVHLPQRGGGGDALILNPDARDLAGFVPLRRGVGAPGTVGGCAMVDRPGAQHLCGPTLLDTGAPGLAVRGAERPPGWQRRVPARLTLVNAAGGPSPGVSFRIDDEPHGAETRFMPSRGGGVSLNAGTLPFYAYNVLSDRERGSIAVRPNGTAGGGDRPVRQ